MKPKLAIKMSLITVCKGESIVFPASALKNVNVVAMKLDLDLDQTSVAHTHTERNKCDKTRGHIVILNLGNVDCTGWYRIFLIFVIAGTARTDSLNSLAEALADSFRLI